MHPPIDQQITFFYTDNLANTARFYEELLGLPLALDQGACRIYQVAAGAYVGFCQRQGFRPDADDCVILTLVTSQVNAWYEHLKSRGIQFEKAPTLNPRFNIYHCFLRDPNGYLIEIQRFLDPNWGQ